MNNKIEIPKELLREADYMNTVNGGMTMNVARGWKEADGYRLIVNTPGLDSGKIHVEVANQRLFVYHYISVMEGKEQIPFYLVNLPVAPDVDVQNITALYENGQLVLEAPLNDWGKGKRTIIDIEKI